MKTMRSKHLTDLGYTTSEGNFIPTRITLRYTLDGNNILYQFACCSHKDQYVKKLGNSIADRSPQYTVPMDSIFSDEKLSTQQMIMTIIIDIEKNRTDVLPYRHRKFFEEHSPSEHIEHQRHIAEMASHVVGLLDNLAEVMMSEDEEETEDSPTIH